MKTRMISPVKPLIEQIEEIVKDIPGWSPVDQLYTLFNLVLQVSGLEGDIIEVGSWCGRSTAVLGAAARMTGHTKLYCVDLFPEKDDWKQNDDGTYSFEVKIGNKIYGCNKDHTVWKEPFERDIAPVYEKFRRVFDYFNDTVCRNNLQDLVIPIKGNTEIFSRAADSGLKCKLAFIDADHGYDNVCRDIRNIEPFLVEGGWICFDDAFSYYEGVNMAITHLIIENPDYEHGQQMTRKFFMARKKKNKKIKEKTPERLIEVNR